jgi:hypothetical protein
MLSSIFTILTAVCAPPGAAFSAELTDAPDPAAHGCEPAPQPGDPPSYCLALCYGIPVPILASPQLVTEYDDLWCASEATLLCQSYGTEYFDHCWGWPEWGD